MATPPQNDTRRQEILSRPRALPVASRRRPSAMFFLAQERPSPARSPDVSQVDELAYYLWLWSRDGRALLFSWCGYAVRGSVFVWQLVR